MAKHKETVKDTTVRTKGNRLSEKDEAVIRKLYAKGGVTQHELAKKYGVSYGKIWNVVGSGQDYLKRVEKHGGPLRTETGKKKHKSEKEVSSNKKTSALAKLKGKKK